MRLKEYRREHQRQQSLQDRHEQQPYAGLDVYKRQELDRVLGGGIVLGSVVLLGGEPGAGKSTLLLQLCGAISASVDVLYITGEESTRQIKLRALRLAVPQENISLAAETDIGSICDLIEATKPGLVVIDSIQTMHSADVSSSSGSVSPVSYTHLDVYKRQVYHRRGIHPADQTARAAPGRAAGEHLAGRGDGYRLYL